MGVGFFIRLISLSLVKGLLQVYLKYSLADLILVKMDAQELQTIIQKAIDEMKGYEAMGGDMVRDAMKDFEKCKEIAATYPNCDFSPVKNKIVVLNGQFSPFASMAPKVGKALETLMGLIE